LKFFNLDSGYFNATNHEVNEDNIGEVLFL
jgi:hypothetical protein